MDLTLTQEQQSAHDLIIDFYRSGKPLLTIGGYAGTGKTTLLGKAAKTLKQEGARIAFCTLSGKASTVLASKLRDILTEDDYCGTIHSLIYVLTGIDKVKINESEIKQKLYFDTHGGDIDFDIIVIDEASMIDYKIFKDLEDYGIPIIAVGDHGQLPPIRGNFNLMEEPDITLEKIMRQAENNPIIKMSIMAREEGNIPYCDLGTAVKTRDRSKINQHDFNDINSIVLCATNKTRVAINSFARKILKKDGIPKQEEPLICLSNNNFKKVFNGNIGILKKIFSHDEIFSVEVDMGDFKYHGDIFKDQFNRRYLVEKPRGVDLFDFAYAITTHKSQGSEWRHVTLYEERMNQSDDNWRRWLYTAITRAKESLLIIK